LNAEFLIIDGNPSISEVACIDCVSKRINHYVKKSHAVSLAITLHAVVEWGTAQGRNLRRARYRDRLVSGCRERNSQPERKMSLRLTEQSVVTELARLLYEFPSASGKNAVSFPMAAAQAGLGRGWPA
jgi:hypothetical protein